jgi:DNA polymerase III alpha subunit
MGFFAGARYAPSGSAADDKIEKLNAKIDQMGKLVGYSLLQQQQNPTNERLQEVLAAAKDSKPSDKVLDDLISAVAFDPSANVRLRALEALFQHMDKPIVRSGVLAALPREQNPLVQLEMIDFVASTHDRDAAPVLEKLAQNEALDRSVRDAAQLARSLL